jgi:hypothetical protein
MGDGGSGMRYLSFLLSGLLALPFPPPLPAAPSPALNLVIVEGEGAINNIRQRTAREPIVQVEDENRRPVAGAVVAFTLPQQGAGGTFANGARTLTSITDSQGRAVARGFRPNNVQGQFQINVTASSAGQTATGTISMTNAVVAAAAGGAAAGGISAKLIAIIAVAGGIAAGGATYAATRNGSSGGGGSTPVPTTISAGNGSVGPPR